MTKPQIVLAARVRARRVTLLLAFLCLAFARTTAAQSTAGATGASPTPAVAPQPPPQLTISVLENRPWFDPTIADQRGPQIAVLALAYSDEFQYTVEPGSRRIWDISLGQELPIVVFERGAGGDREIAPGNWGFGIWAPVDFHMVSDFKDESNPIINTDYRFAGMAKIAYGWSEQTKLAWKVQFGHESTHLGDEFTIHAIETYGRAFERINVSYEYLEAAMNLHREGLWRQGDMLWNLNVRGGCMFVIDRGDPGFYSTDLLDRSRTVFPSKRNYEPWFGVELLPAEGKGWLGDFTPFLSVDGRWKTIFDYQKTSADQPEDSQLSWSVATGLRNVTTSGRGKVDVLMKFYRGVNPNGQFRDQRSYWTVGVGLYLRV